MKRIGLILLTLMLVLAMPLQSIAKDSAGTDAKPDAIVKSIADELAQKLDHNRQELKQNKDKLVAVIDDILLPHFDVDYAAILVLGRHAREATPEQRSRFAKAFYKSITSRYGEALLDYTRGSVKVLPLRGDLNPKRTTVRSRVDLGSGKSASVNYVFRKTKSGEWKVYDVVIEGISYISNYRNQVDGEIKKEGLETFIKKLENDGAKVIKKVEPDNASK